MVTVTLRYFAMVEILLKMFNKERRANIKRYEIRQYHTLKLFKSMGNLLNPMRFVWQYHQRQA